MARINRELRKGELTTKDMSVLREGEAARSQYKNTHGDIKEYSLNHVVCMDWGLVEKKRDLRPFYLTIDDKKFLLSWGELKDMEAGGFFRREGRTTNYKLRYLDGHKLTLDTELNEEAERDMIFRITGDGIEAYLDWYEILRSGRFI